MIDWFGELYRIIKQISYGGTSKKLTAQFIAALNGTLTAGNVVGPSSAVDGNLALFDGTSGKLLKAGLPTEATIDSTTNILVGDGSGNAVDGNVPIIGDGNGNLALGNSALGENTSGLENTAIGSLSLSSNESGFNNTCVGSNSGENIVDGHENTIIGCTSGTEDDPSLTVAVGEGAFTGGDAAIAIGYNTRARGQNSIAIGGALDVQDANVVSIGVNAVTDAYFGNGNAILHGLGDAIVFPGDDPHIDGAAYWVDGVLTRSNG